MITASRTPGNRFEGEKFELSRSSIKRFRKPFPKTGLVETSKTNFFSSPHLIALSLRKHGCQSDRYPPNDAFPNHYR